MKYSALRFPDLQASTTQEAAERFAQAAAEREFGTLDGMAWDVQFDCAPDNLQTHFEFTAIVGMKLLGKEKGHARSFVVWVAGTHRVIDGRFTQTATLGEAIDAQKAAVLTGDPAVQAIPGTQYGYARLASTGKMKCVGMISLQNRNLFASHFAGLLPSQPTLPTSSPIARLADAFLALVPEFMGDQISEPVARLVSLAEYTGGKLTSERPAAA